MKILQTVKYYEPSKGGMETVVKNIVEGISLIKNDIEFTVYANHNNPQNKTVIKLNNITIIKEYTRLLLKSQPLNLKYSNLSKLISESEIIHHHYPFPNLELALIRNFRLLKKKTLIITWHANIKNSRWGFIKFLYNPLIKKILSHAKYIVVTSPQLFENSDILKQYKKKVKVIPLSFNPEHNINVNPNRTIDLNKPRRVLFVGKLRAYKGVSYLINSISDSDCLLTIVGDGEEELLLKNQVKKLGIENRVRFSKNVNNDELVNIYQESDLFVLPSISEAEAFGIVQLEAMAHGIPVINTKLNSGVPFVSLDGISGLTVEPKNSESLRIAINKILNDKALYENYSKGSIERAKLFTREKLALSYLELYLS